MPPDHGRETESTTSLGDASIHGLGYGEASTVLGLSGSGTATFDGQTVDATSALVKYAYYGDANLDGVVNAIDFNIMATNYGLSGKIWTDADFNYDGTVDDADAALLEANYGDGEDAMMADASDPPMEQLYDLLLGNPKMLAMFENDPTLWAPIAPYADGGASPDAAIGSTVPEPASVAMLIGASGSLLLRRRRGMSGGRE